MFDLNLLPELIRRDIEHGERHPPPIPDEPLALVRKAHPTREIQS